MGTKTKKQKRKPKIKLQIIAGPSGAGKSTYIYEKIAYEAELDPKKHYLVLVPLQYSMETQRILVFKSTRKSIMNIDVLSFERLAYRVFDELGTDRTTCIDETGKVLLLRRAASLIQDDLGVLQRNIGKRGYIDEVKSLISELMQYGYTPDDVSDMADRADVSPIFSRKAADIEKLYRKFLELFDKSMFTQEQVLSLLCEVADRSELIRDSVIVLDGYTGFTPVQKELLTRIAPLVDRIYACVTCDTDTDLYAPMKGDELFSMSVDETAFLSRMAADTPGSELLDPVLIDRGHGRFTGTGAMAHLEQDIFRDESHEVIPADGRVELLKLRDVRMELLFTAEKIHELMRKDTAFHYRDIAVVCPDVETYRYLAGRIFEAQGIPVFLDMRHESPFNPLSEFVDAACDLVRKRLSTESLMRLIRSGLTPLTREETDILDNYLYEAAFKSTTYFKKPFVRQTADFRTEDDFRELNEIREKVASPIMAFYDVQKGKKVSVRERLTSLFTLLMAFGVHKRLDQMADEKASEEDMVSEDLYRRLYQSLCDLSDEMVRALGDVETDAADFRDMLLDGLGEIKPATVPKSNDSVVFGDLERTRLGDVKVLFMIGAGDDGIPGAASSGGIFSEEEREILGQAGYELAPTKRQRAFQQKFYLYLCLTKSSDRLYVTYHESAADGTKVRESYLFGEIERLFSDVSVRRIDEDDPVFLETRNSSDIVLAHGLSHVREDSADPDFAQTQTLLYSKLLSGEGDRREAFIKAAYFTNGRTKLSQAVTDALYGKTLTMSISRLETFAKCPCSYLFKYGLHLNERKKNEFASLDLGNLYHGAIEKYAKGLASAGLLWTGITDDEIQDRLKSGFDQQMQQFAASEMLSDAREAHFADRAFSNLLLNTRVMTDALRQGTFAPALFEQELRGICLPSDLTYQIGGGHTLSLTGKIDRIDIADAAGKHYIKIIDYKTGSNKLDPVRIYEGLQLQLLIYMGAAISGITRSTGNEVQPGAVFYHIFNDPRIDEIQTLSDAERELLIEKDLRPSGLIADEEAVIGALDSNITAASGKYDSPAIDLHTKSDGSLGASASLLDLESFEALIQYSKDKAVSIGTSIASGDASVSPYRLGSDSACKYCVYRGVCHFDARLPGYYYRDVSNALGIADDDKRKTGAGLKALVEKVVSADEESNK